MSADRKRVFPRAQILPGMESVRSAKLDQVCESIAEERYRLAKARQAEEELTSTALEDMHAKRITVYKHAGVELVRVPGSEKLRVRLVKDKGNAAVAAGVEEGPEEGIEEPPADGPVDPAVIPEETIPF